MANKKVSITLQVDEKLLENAKQVFDEHNFSIDKAVELYFYITYKNHSLPFIVQEDKVSQSDILFKSIVDVLAGHYDYIYYVDTEDNTYLEFNTNNAFRALEVGETGKDFFTDAINNTDIIIYKNDREKVKEFLNKETLLQALESKGSTSLVYRMITSPKPEYYLMVASFARTDKSKIIFEVRNIDESIRKEQQQARDLEKASSLAHLDSLTKCLNYLAFQEVKDTLSLKIKDGVNDFAILMCDLNELKNINDDSGHLVGDEYLVKTANILREMFPHSKIYRIGGDEFFVVLEGEDFINRIELVKTLKEVSKKNVNINAPVIAVGLAELSDMTRDFSSLFMEADQRMYEHKKQLKQ